MSDKKLTFEMAMTRLEEIVRAMERGDVALEESLQLFQEGTNLVQTCSEMLNHAQMQIQKVVKTADGTPAFEEFNDED